MKKCLSLILSVVLVLTLCACGQDAPADTEPSQTTAPTDAPTEPSSCAHVLEVTQSTAATCTEAGRTVSTCTLCGEEFTEEIPALGHSLTAASCTARPVCTLCGYASGSALGHVYTDGVCIHCGDVLPQDVPTDCQHDYVLSQQTAPTCTGEGSMEYQCSKCGHTYSQTIGATGHRFSEATCTAPKTCIICAQTEGNALGHSYQDGTCSRCGEADPDAHKEVTFTVTIRSDKGVYIEGISVSVYTHGSTPAATGITNAKGVATMTLMSADSYRLVLSDVPAGLTAKESYTFSSTRVNINLTTVAVISPTDHSNANYKVGSAMGDFTLTDTDGKTYNLSALLQEKDMVVLNFWFTTCYWCLQEFPHFEEVAQKYDNIQLLALDPFDSKASISHFKDQNGYTFPMISETIGLAEGFGITGYPTTVFIGSNGQILSIITGAFPSLEALEDHINTLLK